MWGEGSVAQKFMVNNTTPSDTTKIILKDFFVCVENFISFSRLNKHYVQTNKC